eukprot:CAMPEP_0176404116 /NCGR_PEP_ID=MMETSP0126-20121128/50624_1 /TAXON_ID=141414 ORGANISM="Strombidinopsis acuminatum, Strain SPMC142" /NCGR_SAMPLE_ID=MMETSP0126 /ASSEMBLY_ACC=CAM_ASM_000229 /LENGTH=85 /DNA_ID=CAMNT_0017782747 /DNA_START=1389 /DNA_END=1646 /DNA_ORIENTATION=+
MVKFFKDYRIDLDDPNIDDDDPPIFDCRRLLMNFDSENNSMDKRILFKITGRRGAYDKYSDDEDEEYKKKFLDPTNREYAAFEDD